MTPDIEFSYEELQLIKRVLGFATVNIPITDPTGNSIYPTVSTQDKAQELIERLDSLGVPNAAGLYTTFNPETDLKGKTALIWQQREDGYDYQIRGPVTAVLGSDAEGWSVAMGDIVLGPFTRESLKASCQIELDLP